MNTKNVFRNEQAPSWCFAASHKYPGLKPAIYSNTEDYNKVTDPIQKLCVGVPFAF